MSNLEFFGFILFFWFTVGILVGIAVGHAIFTMKGGSYED